MIRVFAMCAAALTLACTNADYDKQVGKLNVPASIVCWSGTNKIYEGHSTGAIGVEPGTGYYFRERESGLFVEVSGNCVVRYDR